MAPSSSGRYQSRLFNWLSQGLGQLEKLQPHIRQLKMKAAWGAQVVFYWAYGLIRTARTGPRLGRAGQQPLATGTASLSDQPIQQILLEVQQSYLSAGLEIADSVSSQQDISVSSIQGIATLLTTRTLVLVTEQNQLLDILTPDQQQQLHYRIRGVANKHQVHIIQATQLQLVSHFQTALGQILSWMPRRLAQPIITQLKTRSIKPATSRQLQASANFGLVANSQSKIGSADSPEAQNLSKIGNALGFLDTVSLRLERQAGRAIQSLQQRFHQNLPPEQGGFRDNNFQIQTLIRAAIAYFFNWKPVRFLSQSSSTHPTLDSGDSVTFASSGSQQLSQGLGQSSAIETGPTQCVKPGQEEPWLTLADLFGGFTQASLAGCELGAASVSISAQAPQGSLTKTSEHPASQSQKLEVSGTSTSTTVDGWMDIETEAILMGYIKHPLEQVLEWLDRGLAWLEELIAALWTHLRPYLSALFQLIQQYWRR